MLAMALLLGPVKLAGTGSHPTGSASAAQSSSGQQASAQPPQSSVFHHISVQFDYDFTKTPACSQTVKTACVQKFGVYDISTRKPYFLFAVPVPANAHGMMKDITASSPCLLFAVGRHRIGVAAQPPTGPDSPLHECKAVVEVKLDTPPPCHPDAPGAPGSSSTSGSTTSSAPH